MQVASYTAITRRSTNHDAAIWVFAALIVYATLYPFRPFHMPNMEQFVAAIKPPKYFTQFDVLLNVLAYVPLGIVLWLSKAHIAHTMRRVLVVIGWGTLFSASLELMQLVVASRVASCFDTLANAVGVAIGALLLANPIGVKISKAVARLRDRTLVGGQPAQFAIILLALWLFGQSNPSIPFFEAGNIHASSAVVGPHTLSELNARRAIASMQLIGVSVSVAGFAFFVSSILRSAYGALRMVIVLVALAMIIKLIMATLILKADLALEWIDGNAALGMAIGIVIFIPLRRLRPRLRVYFGILFIAAGAVLTKVSSFYDAANQVLQVFNWPYGQIDRFATLTRYIYETWPIAALFFLLFVFFKPPEGWTTPAPNTKMS